MQIILITFTAAAIVGVILASRVLRGVIAPWSMSFLHGSLGALGLLMIGFELLTGDEAPLLITAFITLLIAAIGGFYLLSFHARKVIPKKTIVFIHATVAVLGFLLLVLVFIDV